MYIQNGRDLSLNSTCIGAMASQQVMTETAADRVYFCDRFVGTSFRQEFMKNGVAAGTSYRGYSWLTEVR